MATVKDGNNTGIYYEIAAASMSEALVALKTFRDKCHRDEHARNISGEQP